MRTDDLETFTSFQLGPMEAINSIEVLTVGHLVDLIVIEDFRISTATVKKTRQYDALYIIGALRYIAWKAGVNLEMHLPHEREFATNARLKEMGWRNITEGGHADDATRHLLVTLVRQGVVDPTRFLPDTP